ncbi:MAG TPA: hypothetical protein VNH44_16630 [Micropepsaceae bacterium]|nr:hypothetical protein [Micropepsaceae bacterium]
MIRLLFILIIAGLVALGAAWIADHDVTMTLTVGSYEIRTTAAVAILLLLVLFLILWLFLHLVFSVFTGLTTARRALSGKHNTPLPPPAPEILPPQPRIPS